VYCKYLPLYIRAPLSRPLPSNLPCTGRGSPRPSSIYHTEAVQTCAQPGGHKGGKPSQVSQGRRAQLALPTRLPCTCPTQLAYPAPRPPLTNPPTLHLPTALPCTHHLPTALPCTSYLPTRLPCTHHLPTALPCTSHLPPTKSPTLHRLPCTAILPLQDRPPSHQVPRSPNRPTLHRGPAGDGTAGSAPPPSQHHTSSPVRLAERSRWRALAGKSRRRRAYPQQIVTTRLLYCLQDPFAQLSRLQRI
jgi:hypothetical protein